MEVVHEMTMDYLRTRRQFGSALSQFQVLQHRAVDMFINIEEVRSLVMNAAAKGWSDDPKERIRSVSAAKALTNRASRHVAQEAIQLHGGMGMTQELPLADYVRRLLSIDLMFGGERFQRQRFANADTQKVDGAAFVSPKKRWKQI
jgi:alkylation response protein AidB-like acyl-CoA dehydrogenase